MRLRRSTSLSSGTSTRKGRIVAAPSSSCVVTDICGLPLAVRAGSSGGAVGGEERRQRRKHLLRSLLGDPVAGAGDDHGLHVLREGLHPLSGKCAPALLSTDPQDGNGERRGLAQLVLGLRGVPPPIEPEGGPQGVLGAVVEADVVVD